MLFRWVVDKRLSLWANNTLSFDGALGLLCVNTLAVIYRGHRLLWGLRACDSIGSKPSVNDFCNLTYLSRLKLRNFTGNP